MNQQKVYTAIATVFGVGRLPFAPGTAASIVALPIAWLIVALSGSPFLLLFAGLLVNAIGAWACELYSRDKGEKDPSECVIDEVAGQWIACAFIPTNSSIGFMLLGYSLAFVLFRVFDILKPWPISAAERLPGGIGIMADDFVAGLAAGAVIAVLAHLGLV
ncbi:MAG: phosphatidylglycerophosphatase A [Rhizomicrobium sp.]|jgi:phosphatidylglycerophosphatase A